MRTRFSVARCCCEPVTSGEVTPTFITTADWGDTNVSFPGIGVDPQINKFILIDLQDLGWAWVFTPGDVPLSLATAIFRFTGAATGSPEQDQDFAVYAGYDPGGVGSIPIADLEGPTAWPNPSTVVWGVGGSTRVTPDIASIINAVTSDPGFDFATDALIVVTRCLTLSASTPTRFMDTTAPLLAPRLEYTL